MHSCNDSVSRVVHFRSRAVRSPHRDGWRGAVYVAQTWGVPTALQPRSRRHRLPASSPREASGDCDCLPRQAARPRRRGRFGGARSHYAALAPRRARPVGSRAERHSGRHRGSCFWCLGCTLYTPRAEPFYMGSSARALQHKVLNQAVLAAIGFRFRDLLCPYEMKLVE